MMFDHEFSTLASVFTEFKYSNTESFARSSPSFDFFLALQEDYPFLTPNIRAGLEQAKADGTYDPFGDAEFFGITGPLVSRDHFDLGVRDEDIERETIGAVIGMEGDFSNGFHYEMSYVYGETDVDNKTDKQPTGASRESVYTSGRQGRGHAVPEKYCIR